MSLSFGQGGQDEFQGIEIKIPSRAMGSAVKKTNRYSIKGLGFRTTKESDGGDCVTHGCRRDQGASQIRHGTRPQDYITAQVSRSAES